MQKQNCTFISLESILIHLTRCIWLNSSTVPMRGAVVEWLEQLSYGAESRRIREFKARLRHAATGKLSLSTQQKMGTFFELGKDKAAKGEGWAPPFISCAQDTVGL